MRDKYLRLKIKPSAASSGSPGCSQALIWVLIGLRLGICMLINAGNGLPLWPGVGLVGKCQVRGEGKDLGSPGWQPAPPQ